MKYAVDWSNPHHPTVVQYRAGVDGPYTLSHARAKIIEHAERQRTHWGAVISHVRALRVSSIPVHHTGTTAATVPYGISWADSRNPTVVHWYPGVDGPYTLVEARRAIVDHAARHRQHWRTIIIDTRATLAADVAATAPEGTTI